MSKGAKQTTLDAMGSATLAVKSGALTPAEGYLAGLTVAHFTEREIHELRKACRDLRNSGEGSELAGKFLEAAVARAKVAK